MDRIELGRWILVSLAGAALVGCRSDGERGPALADEIMPPARIARPIAPIARRDALTVTATAITLIEARGAAATLALDRAPAPALRAWAAAARVESARQIEALHTAAAARGLPLVEAGADPLIAAERDALRREQAALDAVAGDDFARAYLDQEARRLTLLGAITAIGERATRDVDLGNALRMIAAASAARAARIGAGAR